MPTTAARKLAAIASIDMAGYSARAERDEVEAARCVRDLEARVAAAAASNGGRIFNSAGDGFMAEFASANDALVASLTLIADPPEGAPPVRIGVHIGDVVLSRNDDLLGHAVNVAARLRERAADNCVVISRAVYDLVRGPMATRFHPIGRITLDKMDEPIGAFVHDPLAEPGHGPRRRRRRDWIAAALAAIAAIAAIASLLWSAGIIGPSRAEMLERIAKDLTRDLVSVRENSQEAIDSAHSAIMGLSQSTHPAERAAFSYLRDGETASAVGALEILAADLEREGHREAAAAAWARAGALAQFEFKDRALADFRKAFDLAPNSRARFADLMQAISATQGPAQAAAFAEQILRRRPPPPPDIAIYARLVGSMGAGDLNQTARQRRLLEDAAQRIPETSDRYLIALERIARGYLAFQELDLRRARALYLEGRQAMARLPGHERDHQQGWLLTLSAMGDFEAAWTEGRLFLAERERAGAPPWSPMTVTTCIAGLQLGQVAQAAPYCLAGARGVAGSVNEPTGEVALTMLAAAQGDLIGARAHLAAARNSRWFQAVPANIVYAGWAEASIAAASRDFDAVQRIVSRTIAQVRGAPALAPRAELFIALLENARAQWAFALNERAEGCAALIRARAAYAAIGGDPGAARAGRDFAAAGCR